MIVRVARNAKNLRIGRVIVGTDSREIYDECQKNNIETVITMTSHKSGTDRVFEVYNKIKEEFDLVVNLQGDLPIFKKELFKKMIKLFSDKSVDMGSAVCDLNEEEIEDNNIVKAKVKLDKDNTGYALDFLRKINCKNNMYHHIGVYIYRPNVLKEFVTLPQSEKERSRSLEQMRAMDNNYKIKLVKVSHNPPSVDTIDDLKKIRLHFEKNDF
jgi:3-deoxy-manno-octulosonate cytidylyltransferase (CMP-KDO synthetase)